MAAAASTLNNTVTFNIGIDLARTSLISNNQKCFFSPTFNIQKQSFPKKLKSNSKICYASQNFTSPKTGAVGEDRFRENAENGTYWGNPIDSKEKVEISFYLGNDEPVTVTAKAGENLLRIAENSGVMKPNIDFCFEGTCCHCEMEVEGGAYEVGYRAERYKSELVRSCICPVPSGKSTLQVNVLSEESAWVDGVL